MNQFLKNKVCMTYNTLKELAEKRVVEVPELLYKPCDYKTEPNCPNSVDGWATFNRADRVKGRDKHYWFYTEIKTPRTDNNKQIELEFRTGLEDQGIWDALNPQGLLYLNGEIIQGIDINHYTAVVDSDTDYELFVYFYTGMNECDTNFRININEVDLRLRDLYYDLKVAQDSAECFDEESYNFIKGTTVLEQVCNRIDFRNPMSEEFFQSVANANDFMHREYFEKLCGKSDAVVNYIGHTHIDVAWQWTLAQTREKVQRSFSTVLKLMELYPEYVFMSSQPQLYAYLKNEAPKLYEKVKERIAEGRWEAEGAMWLEADCNLASGESLVRQILLGKKFMRDEFGVESKVLWLPDVFGYSAALPQILKKSGIDKFVTSKISWNETNKMPYDTFMWEGIDGSEIFTYFITAQDAEVGRKPVNYTTYVGMVEPKMNLGTWERYQQKEYNNETLVTYGYGDGGGGPTYDMLEKLKRLSYGMPGMPKAQISRAGDFLKRVYDNFDENCKKIGRIPKWVGELYLELHRGTYTSMAKNKRKNRKCEFLLQETETLAVIGNILLNKEYPHDKIDKNWHTLLLNQFHDIIPGSSIKEVYDDSDRDYAEIKSEIGNIQSDCLSAIAQNVSEKGVLVFNPNSFCASDYVWDNTDEKWIYAKDIPPMGWKVIDEAEMLSEVKANIEDRTIESEHYTIRFDENMNIASLFDKDYNRETAAYGGKLNQLVVYEDYPKAWDNWEITSYYKQKKWSVDDVTDVKAICGNGFGGFKIKRTYMNSIIEQDIIAYSDSRRIDVKNHIDWHENHVLLKAEFNVNIHTNKALYDVQFGNLERPNHENTSWDAAKFEVCAHKWGDLSEEDYGISILNDCKYGYSADGNKMTLSLIKCGTFPNAEADIGKHNFIYSVYPHAGNPKSGGTIREAYLLNRPMSAMDASGGGSLSPEYSFVSADCGNIIIETVKQAENGNGIIVRLFDSWNMKSKVHLNFGVDVKSVYLCDLSENPISELSTDGKSTDVEVSNFEIVTVLVENNIIQKDV